MKAKAVALYGLAFYAGLMALFLGYLFGASAVLAAWTGEGQDSVVKLALCLGCAFVCVDLLRGGYRGLAKVGESPFP